MTKSINGSIESANQVRSGVTSKGRPWIMYQVVINGEKFTTFDAAYLSNIGKLGTWEYEEKPSADGQFINRTLSKYPEVKSPSSVPSSVPSSGSDGLINDKVVSALGLMRNEMIEIKLELKEIKDLINAISVEVPDNAMDLPQSAEKELPVINV